MHREAGRQTRIKNTNKLKELCYIAGYVQGDQKYRETLMEHLESRLDDKPLKTEPMVDEEEAKQVLAGWFGMYRRSLGY
jgi:hypothetical protein